MREKRELERRRKRNMSQYVRGERVGNVSVWTIDRPSARNAIDDRIVGELETMIAAAERDSTLRAVVLTGGGDVAFLAGADLKLLRRASPDLLVSINARVLSVLARVETLPVPVIAAVNGMVLGGGCEIALACDLRIAEEHASVTFKHALLGVTPGWGGLPRLCRVVGPGTAAKLLLTALPMTAREAREVGFFDEVVAKGTAKRRALELARAVELTSPSATADLKRLLRLGYMETLTLDEEQRVFLARAQSYDHREALSALFEKREPHFEPRR
jgi:enoyl-CoA hydratase